MNYTFYFKRHNGTTDGTIEKAVIEGNLIKDALQKWCKKCIAEDDTGIFFELEDADINYLRKQKHFICRKAIMALFSMDLNVISPEETIIC